MQSKASSIQEYLNSLPDERREAITKLHETILKALPKGFETCMSYGMIGYVVPHSIYPKGYHCDPKLPLPFISLASQKNAISLYHMGIYANEELLNWFTSEYASRVKGKLDMGKSCIRFKKPEQIPFDLIAELAQKWSPADWISTYETLLKR
ncbi:MAG: DUF1801 domain-containing protein [Bacteroidetes bacterium]|nr:DUF1801 domain-containing protein [Bacteroidota bacterium]